MPFKHGKFSGAGQVKSAGEKPPKNDNADKQKTPPASTPKEKGKGPAQQNQQPAVQHVTQTHPGETQPHPMTGVHAVHAHHKGGGAYTTHTHHDGGDVETNDHGSAAEMHGHMQQALPDDGMGQPQQPTGMDDALGGVGGDADSDYGA